jgi:PAS domain S-box-containing protein
MELDPPPAPASPGDAQIVLRSAMRLGGLGAWRRTLATRAVALSPEAERIFGFAPGQFDGRFDTWLAHVHPDDRGNLPAIEEAVRAGQRTFAYDYRFITPAGSERRLKSDCEAIVGEDGLCIALVGTVADITEQAKLREAVRAGQERDALSYEWQWEQDAEYRFTAIHDNPRQPIPRRGSVLGLRRWERPGALPLRGTWDDHIRQLELRRPFRDFEMRVGTGKAARYVSISGYPVFDAHGQFTGYRGTALNITRRIQAEEAARENRLLLEHASRLGQLGAWSLTVRRMHLAWSDESRAILGYDRQARVSWREALAHVDGPWRATLARAVDDCIARGTPFSVQVRAHDVQGRTVWLRVIGERQGPQHARHVIGAIQDVSAKEESARKLQELGDRLIATLESITDAFFTLDRYWRFTYVNGKAEKMGNLPREQLLGKVIWAVYPESATSRFRREYERAMAEQVSVHLEEYSSSMRAWVRASAYPSEQGLAVYFRDVTQEKTAARALQASEERFRMLFSTSLDAILQSDTGGGILAANDAACRMFGLTEGELRRRGRFGVTAEDDARRAALLRELDERGTCLTQLTMLRGDGSRFEAEISAARYQASDGLTYTNVIVRDISEQLRQQAEIVSLNRSLSDRVRERTAELEAANAELRAFAHSLAHDVRAPLAVVEGFGQRVEEALASEQFERERDYVARMRGAAVRVNEYVEALLSLARISQTRLRVQRVDLSATAEAILSELRLREPGRVVHAHVDPGLVVQGDEPLLRMALENLLANAWKFSARRAAAEISLRAAPASDGGLAFCVRDNGAGFSMDYASRLFVAFQRLHGQDEFPGTGIGLANVSRIVARHGGRVWAEAAEGQGAAFFFTVPAG